MKSRNDSAAPVGCAAPPCSQWRPTPETTKAWHDALDWCRGRKRFHDPQHAALANLAEKLERERDAALAEVIELRTIIEKSERHLRHGLNCDARSGLVCNCGMHEAWLAVKHVILSANAGHLARKPAPQDSDT